MALHRYAIPDKYTTAELAARFRSLRPAERIAFAEDLLEEAGEDGWLQPVLRRILLRDRTPWVRAWAVKRLAVYDEDPDGDPFVRAASYESPHYSFPIGKSALTPVGQKEPFSTFNALTPLERLAAVRGPNFRMIKALFDQNDTELKITRQERIDLLFAFLSGAAARGYASRSSNWTRNPSPSELWRLAAQWPIPRQGRPRQDGSWEYGSWEETKYDQIRRLVFEHIDVDDDTRFQIFEENAARPRELRYAILKSAPSRSKCLKAALNDDDDEIRGQAWARFRFSAFEEEWRSALGGYDLAALRGLCRNRSIRIKERQELVITRLEELGDHDRALLEERLLSDELRSDQKAKEPDLNTRIQDLQNQLASLRAGLRVSLGLIAILLLATAVGSWF